MHFGGATRLGRAGWAVEEVSGRKEDPGSTGDHGQRETASPLSRASLRMADFCKARFGKTD